MCHDRKFDTMITWHWSWDTLILLRQDYKYKLGTELNFQVLSCIEKLKWQVCSAHG